MRWPVARVVLAASALAALGACEPLGAPNENPTRAVEGCDEAVKHLRGCCPRFNSYVSCTYLTNAVPSPDLSSSQSRCVQKRSCAEIERAIVAGDRVCGFAAPTRQCR